MGNWTSRKEEPSQVDDDVPAQEQDGHWSETETVKGEDDHSSETETVEEEEDEEAHWSETETVQLDDEQRWSSETEAAERDDCLKLSDTEETTNEEGQWSDTETVYSEVESLEGLQLEDGIASDLAMKLNDGVATEEELYETDFFDAEADLDETAKLNVYPCNEIMKDKLIGAGEFGKVYKANLRKSSLTVAVKVFNADFNYKKTIAQVSKLAGLRHRNIAVVLGLLGSANSSETPLSPLSVLFHYYNEGNLIQYLTNHKKPHDYITLMKLALDVIEGCEYLHSRNVVHGNLSARNIMIERQFGRVSRMTHYNAKVTDYGIVQIAPTEAISSKYYMRTPGGLLVDVRWSPKELFDENAKRYTMMADIWSFGVVLWEILTNGSLIPYGRRKEDFQVVEDIKRGLSPLDILIPEGYPQDIINVLKRIFQVDPGSRPTFSVLKEKFTDMIKELVSAAKEEKGSQLQLISINDLKSPRYRDWITAKKQSYGPDQFSKQATPRRGYRSVDSNRGLKPLIHERSTTKFKPPSLMDCKGRSQMPMDNGSASEDPSPIAEFQALGRSSGERSYGAPPPYTARPLPNHLAFMNNAARDRRVRERKVDFNREIRRKEKELERLRVEKLKNEASITWNKLQNVVTQLTSMHNRPVESGGRSRNSRKNVHGHRTIVRNYGGNYALPPSPAPMVPASVTSTILRNLK